MNKIIKLTPKKLFHVIYCSKEKAYKECRNRAWILYPSVDKKQSWLSLSKILGLKLKSKTKNSIRLAVMKHLNVVLINKNGVKNNPTNDFYNSKEWINLRYRALKKHGAICIVCGRTPREHGITIHVDHIQPRSKYPELALEETNLQIMCEDCNLGKSNKDCIDWSKKG